MPGDFVLLALTNLGEAIVKITNIAQRGGQPGDDFGEVRFSLRRAAWALDGKVYVPPEPDPKHGNENAETTANIGGTG